MDIQRERERVRDVVQEVKWDEKRTKTGNEVIQKGGGGKQRRRGLWERERWML